jgi:uroporphyrinogen-III decarboxylase
MDSHTSFEHEHFWKDFENEYDAVRYYMQNTDYHFDSKKYSEADARVGDFGLVIVGAQETPLKKIINLAGPQNALIWAMEGDSRLDDLVEIHTEKCLTYAREVAASNAFGMMSMDNLCAMFYSPFLFNRCCRTYFQRMGEVLHAKGKFWCSHACGHVSRLRDLVADVKLDGLEGPPHAPLGDIDLANFRDSISYSRHIVWGGMTCNEQEIAVEANDRIREYVSGLFKRMRPFNRFIFSSSCNTSIRTPFDNLLYLRDACYEFGRAS